MITNEAEEEVEDLFESVIVLETPTSFDAELYLVTLMPTHMTEKEMNNIGSVLWNVQDGQQQIVTLCCFIAAICDCLVHHWEGTRQKDVSESSKSLFPTKLGKEDVV